MKIKIIQIIIGVLFCFTTSAWADRLLYTSELVEGATLIGIWGPNNIEQKGEELELKNPNTVLKGDVAEINKTRQYSARLKRAIKQIQEQGEFILFLRLDENRADLASDLSLEPYNYLTLKIVKTVIQQCELQNKWKTLPFEEQVERSDIIVSGIINTGEEYPKEYTLITDKVYRGVPPKKLWILTVADDKLNKESIFFIQRYVGSGPDYIVMYSVTLENAKDYLRELKETRVSQKEDALNKK